MQLLNAKCKIDGYAPTRVGAQPKPSPAGKGDRSRWMRRTPPALTIGFLIKPIGANSVHPQNAKCKIQTPRIRTHTVRPYEFVRRARSFGRVAPSRMTRGFQECKHSARFPRMQAFGAGSRFSPTANPAAMRKWLPYKRLLPRGSSAVGGEGVSLPK